MLLSSVPGLSEIVARLKQDLSPLTSVYFNYQCVDVHFEWTDDYIGLIVAAPEICRIHVPKRYDGFDVVFRPTYDALEMSFSIDVSAFKHNLYA